MFITLEGIEGSGKTSQMRHIERFLKENGRPCALTREPGGTEIGRKIREILLDPANNALVPSAELLLYTADRAQHVIGHVKPLLEKGITVVCDRYFDATLAYQGYARGLDIDVIRRLHQLIINGLKPDLTFLLDLSPGIGLKRAWKQIHAGSREAAETRFEEEKIEFHEKVRSGYLEIAKNDSARFEIIDASRTEDEVRKEILERLGKRIL